MQIGIQDREQVAHFVVAVVGVYVDVGAFRFAGTVILVNGDQAIQGVIVVARDDAIRFDQVGLVAQGIILVGCGFLLRVGRGDEAVQRIVVVRGGMRIAIGPCDLVAVGIIAVDVHVPRGIGDGENAVHVIVGVTVVGVAVGVYFL